MHPHISHRLSLAFPVSLQRLTGSTIPNLYLTELQDRDSCQAIGLWRLTQRPQHGIVKKRHSASEISLTLLFSASLSTCSGYFWLSVHKPVGSTCLLSLCSSVDNNVRLSLFMREQTGYRGLSGKRYIMAHCQHRLTEFRNLSLKRVYKRVEFFFTQTYNTED